MMVDDNYEDWKQLCWLYYIIIIILLIGSMLTDDMNKENGNPIAIFS